jgi:hypothetical protein
VTPVARALARYNTVEEIETAHQAALRALISRSSVLIHINQMSNPDGRASAGITLTTRADQEQFIADCEGALSIKDEEAPATPSSIRFDQRQLEV